MEGTELLGKDGGFKWDKETEAIIGEGSIIMKAKPSSNYFITPIDGTQFLNAHFYHTICNADFCLTAKVSHEFTTCYDACALMAVASGTVWAKLCFEYTDIGTHAVVSVVTNGTSDDANGVDIQGNSIFLQLSKKGEAFAMHYSVDGKAWKMVRLFRLPANTSWKVGLSGQSPIGPGCDCKFEEVKLTCNAPLDLRRGS
jgi:regulation of enolase protein 1 (concanavalin A-like superfamily)